MLLCEQFGDRILITIDKRARIEIGRLPHYGSDAILYADVDLSEIERGKYFDVVRHYARPDVFQLRVNEQATPAVAFEKGAEPSCGIKTNQSSKPQKTRDVRNGSNSGRTQLEHISSALPYAACACWLTTDSAISVSAASVSFSS